MGLTGAIPSYRSKGASVSNYFVNQGHYAYPATLEGNELSYFDDFHGAAVSVQVAKLDVTPNGDIIATDATGKTLELTVR